MHRLAVGTSSVRDAEKKPKLSATTKVARTVSESTKTQTPFLWTAVSLQSCVIFWIIDCKPPVIQALSWVEISMSRLAEGALASVTSSRKTGCDADS